MIRRNTFWVFLIWVMGIGSVVDGGPRGGQRRGIDDEVKAQLTSIIAASFGERSPVGDIRFGALGPRKSTVFEVALPSKGCYRFAIAAQSSVSDLSLALFDGEKEVGRDRLSGKTPTVSWCALKPTTIKVELFMYGGRGAFALAVFGDTARVVSTGVHKIGGDRNDFIGNRIRQLYAQFAEKRIPVSPFLKGQLSPGESATFEIAIESGCVTVIGVGDPAAKDFEVSLSTAEGVRVGSGKARSGFVAFEVKRCPVPKGVYHLRVEMAEGSGTFGAQLYLK
jgi:hypothetical protein